VGGANSVESSQLNRERLPQRPPGAARIIAAALFMAGAALIARTL